MNVLFHGQALGGVSHYRTKLPARHLEAGSLLFTPSGDPVEFHDTGPYEAVVMQTPDTMWHLQDVLKYQDAGMRVFANVDDWLQGAKQMRGKHGNVTAEGVRRHEKILRRCDGVIASTEWLANRLHRFNQNVVVARNGLDLERYDVPLLEDDGLFVIGWAGGVGHAGALGRIASQVMRMLDEIPDSVFMVIGQRGFSLGDAYKDRVVSVPFLSLEGYPRVLARSSVILAPVESNDFFRAKSQLRVMEAGALGIPVVADPFYDEVSDGVDGLFARCGDDWFECVREIADQESVRDAMGQALRAKAEAEWDIRVRVGEWSTAVGAL